jgi:hypothetical protein
LTSLLPTQNGGHILERTGFHEATPRRIVFDQVHHLPEYLQVEIVLVLGWGNDQKEKVGRFLVHRLEIDTFLRSCEQDGLLLNGQSTAVRKRNALADGRAAKAFPVEQHLQYDVPVFQVVVLANEVNHLGERISLVVRFEIEYTKIFFEVSG